MSNAVLEKKLYLAKESPEPVFDLSDCDLKRIPDVCMTIKVLRKECLCLQNNQLIDLKNVKNFSDLCLLITLDLSFNRITELPEHIKYLKNLQVFRLNNNCLTSLPNEIGSLQNLRELIVSFNKLKALPETICKLRELHVLDLRKNHIRSLPISMYQNQKLRSLLVDQNDKWICPPESVIVQGTKKILSFLAQKSGVNECLSVFNEEADTSTVNDSIESLDLYDKIIQDNLRRLEDEKARTLLRVIDTERNILDQQENDLVLHQQNQNEKQKFLAEIMVQQQKIDDEVQIQQEWRKREQERFIRQISCVKNISDEVIKQLLETNAEQKKQSVDSLISSMDEKLPLSDVQSQRVLESMEKMLLEEYAIETTIQEKELYRKNFINIVRNTEEEELQSKVETFLSARHDQQKSLISDIKSDTDLQHAALLMLLEKSDSRSIELRNQIMLIQNQLLNLTSLELQNRRLDMDMHINDIAEKRTMLSELLMNIFEQQEAYHKQMLEELHEMEQRQTLENRQHYWLKQYQRLLDLQPDATKTINPSLLYELSMYGVSHYAPLLAICRENLKAADDYAQITDSDLERVGINDKGKRSVILRVISNWLERSEESKIVPTAPKLADIDDQSPSAPSADEFHDSIHMSLGYESNECVICMEKQSRVIFLSCGHLCSCLSCSTVLSHCPLCRGVISHRMQIFTS